MDRTARSWLVGPRSHGRKCHFPPNVTYIKLVGSAKPENGVAPNRVNQPGREVDRLVDRSV